MSKNKNSIDSKVNAYITNLFSGVGTVVEIEI